LSGIEVNSAEKMGEKKSCSEDRREMAIAIDAHRRHRYKAARSEVAG
jgi:hypothetical protein